MDAISEAIRYVGVDDTGRQTFESQYPLPAGMSYNSYVVAGTRRTAILDTVGLSGGAPARLSRHAAYGARPLGQHRQSAREMARP